MGFFPTAATINGLLNKVRTSVTVAAFPQLNVTAAYMAKSQVHVTFDGPFNAIRETATGIVNAPEPYTQGTLVINAVRSQIIAASWLAQAQSTAVLGPVSILSDSTSLPTITLYNASIQNQDPGAFDAGDPAYQITLKGIFYLNALLWAAGL